MITIYVKTQAEQQFAEAAMDHELMTNVNLNGASYEVLIDEDQAYSIDGAPGYEGNKLMNVVFAQPSEI
jgi:hypothetical protein